MRMRLSSSAQEVAADHLPLAKRVLFGAITALGVPFAVLALIEGASSLLLVAFELSRPVQVVAGRTHIDYDSLLGWANRPSLFDRDLYGPGVYLRTNAQGFRNDHPFPTAAPPGRIRLVCSGDSFTLGWGVDNDHTWCALLERKNPRLDTVNMGQSGYGADQAYLWYKRDGRPLQHDLQIFAVVLDDFVRMRSSFFGYLKPVLVREGDTLRVANVPVPRWSYRMPHVAAFLDQK